MSNPFSSLKLIFSSILAFLFILAVLFVPAGSLFWPSGWLFVVVFFVYAVFVGGWLKRNSPGLAGKRFSLKVPVKGWDKVIMLLLGVFVVALLVALGKRVWVGGRSVSGLRVKALAKE